MCTVFENPCPTWTQDSHFTSAVIMNLCQYLSTKLKTLFSKNDLTIQSVFGCLLSSRHRLCMYTVLAELFHSTFSEFWASSISDGLLFSVPQGTVGDHVPPGKHIEEAWSSSRGPCGHLHACVPTGRGCNACLCQDRGCPQCCLCWLQCTVLGWEGQ